MADLFWPGDGRAGDLFSDEALVAAMVDIEEAWLVVLVDAGVAPATASVPDLAGVVGRGLTDRLATESEYGGNPAMALVDLLRSRLGDEHPDAATWLHRGLTSQDVVDSALMICARDAVSRIRADLQDQAGILAQLVEEHRDAPLVARTLTQHAVPTTFGLKAAGWLTGVLDANDDLAALAFPVQVGGAAGTRAGAVELASGLPEPGRVADRMAHDLALRLRLSPSTPWHTSRAIITRLGDAGVLCTDAWGRIAGDVLVMSRPELGELSEGSGGPSSTMPHKANPVLATLIRRAAITTPQLAATLHLAAAETTDERSSGPWHAEWATLRTLMRRIVVAGAQVSDLLRGLQVNVDRMRQTLAAADTDAHAEQRSLAELTGRHSRPTYVGTSDALIDACLARAVVVRARSLPHPSLPQESP